MQASKFGGTFDQLFLWIFSWNFHRRRLSTSSIPWCKKVKNDQKPKSRGGSCLNSFKCDSLSQTDRLYLDYCMTCRTVQRRDRSLSRNTLPWHCLHQVLPIDTTDATAMEHLAPRTSSPSISFQTSPDHSQEDTSCQLKSAQDTTAMALVEDFDFEDAEGEPVVWYKCASWFVRPAAVKLPLWHHWMHPSNMLPVMSENQFHCTSCSVLFVCYQSKRLTLCRSTKTVGKSGKQPRLENRI